eukprot:501473_1
MCFSKRCCSIFIIILAIIIGFITNKLFKMGLFSTITVEQEHGNDNCEILTNKNKNLFGCEDIAEFEDGSIILSCTNRSLLFSEQLSSKPMSQVMMETSYKHPGHLFFMKNINSKINSDKFSEIKLINRQSPDFHPHGINVITDTSNIKWIYVINHRRDGDFVEIYQFDENKRAAIFKDEVHSPLFVMINDLKTVLSSQTNKIGFYVTNSFGFQLKTKMNMLESVLGLHQNDLMFCEQDMIEYKDIYSDKLFKQPWKCKCVDRSIGFGNGIDMSMDGKTVYVVEMMEMRIRIYDRNITDNTLKQRGYIVINSGGDNLYLDRKTGDLYVGCHPNMMQLIQHTMGYLDNAPSQVLHWNAKNGVVNEMYLSNGH